MYSDLNLYPSPNMTTDLESIKNAIDVCIAFSPKERLNNPQFGCDLEELLFEPLDKRTEFLIRHALLR
jgi:phage baseplate assembly protein W